MYEVRPCLPTSLSVKTADREVQPYPEKHSPLTAARQGCEAASGREKHCKEKSVATDIIRKKPDFPSQQSRMSTLGGVT